jgi:hypothetical protein
MYTYLVYLRLILTKSVSIFDYTAALKNELERMQKEAVATYLRYYPGICLERMGNHKKVHQGNWCPGQDLKRAPPEYKLKALLLQPLCLVLTCS